VQAWGAYQSFLMRYFSMSLSFILSILFCWQSPLDPLI